MDINECSRPVSKIVKRKLQLQQYRKTRKIICATQTDCSIATCAGNEEIGGNVGTKRLDFVNCGTVTILPKLTRNCAVQVRPVVADAATDAYKSILRFQPRKVSRGMMTHKLMLDFPQHLTPNLKRGEKLCGKSRQMVADAIRYLQTMQVGLKEAHFPVFLPNPIYIASAIFGLSCVTTNNVFQSYPEMLTRVSRSTLGENSAPEDQQEVRELPACKTKKDVPIAPKTRRKRAILNHRLKEDGLAQRVGEVIISDAKTDDPQEDINCVIFKGYE